ncbi:MAG TPA: hypothetical protein VJG65_01915 [Patescibacteria group bacterium]|nr:hypothetical protein [Patescibacteria group bacterium]
MAKNNSKTLFHRWTLKVILDLWTIVTIIVFIADFFSANIFDSSASAVGIIYLAILGIYATDKEYLRWRNHFVSRFLGESYIVIWTAIMIIFVLTATFSAGRYRLPAEFAIIYTSIIGIFALTQHSKAMRAKN